ncbi:oxidoreductase [Hymenobacter negativus]|uniref:SDR family NAD(P)-dependent oxidoreductase n=1 Tax=Hymenobacter negativus TaxID=2795026 RepID=A0ABS3QKP3_9BACT|nr:oxidoreductase [Hymenobacter negativus]MBO2011583.1 SDR family NAD(P)-dependent oxidoreductase [Hymenobacter negativus]
MMQQKVWLVTGATKGFGLEITKAALDSGDRVIATVRSQPDALATTLHHHANLFTAQMDVTDEAQVQQAVQQGVAHFGRLDVVVNNAGYGLVAALEEATDAEVRQQYDTNVFGVLNVVRAVLPIMRRQRAGYLINISSIDAHGAFPGWGVYGSTKFALEGISKGLAVELAPFGIQVTAISPGLFRTDFLGPKSRLLAGQPIAEYDDTAVGDMRTDAAHLHGNEPGDPRKLARIVVDLARTEQPPAHLLLGKDAVIFYQTNTANMVQEMEQWLPISTSTDLDNA